MSAAGILRVVPAGTFRVRRSMHMFERNVIVYRKAWVMLVSGFFEPLFYLLSLGIGLNSLVGGIDVGGTTVSYAAFVAPGMLATSAMNGSLLDATFNTFFRLKISKTFDVILATPLTVQDIAIGDLSWCVARGGLYSAAFCACMWILGDATSPWSVLALPAAILTSIAFACVGMAGCTYLRSWQDFDLITLAVMPMFLFSGTFFPITQYPTWLQHVVEVTPLYQAVALCRGCSLGQFNWAMLGHTAYLVVMAWIGLSITTRRFRGLLTP